MAGKIDEMFMPLCVFLYDDLEYKSPYFLIYVNPDIE